MKVSIIIPVYNAAPFIEEAVLSATIQPECGEILLIEDGSTDDSLAICEKLKADNEKVNVLRHEDGKNHGAGVSRNLGIVNAQFEWIAFLDADDYYLPGRFQNMAKMGQAINDFDGFAESVGAIFVDEIVKMRY